MFEQLISGIDDEIVHRIDKMQVQQPPQMPQSHRHIVKQAAGDSSISPSLQSREVSQPDQNSRQPKNMDQRNSALPSASISGTRKKLGRNDKCWCGSGKKYKKCHYPN
jgi:preprotein translocase subunit SecA